MNSYYERLFSTIVPSVDTEAALDENVSTPAKIFDLRVVRKLAVMRVFQCLRSAAGDQRNGLRLLFDVPGNLRFPGTSVRLRQLVDLVDDGVGELARRELLAALDLPVEVVGDLTGRMVSSTASRTRSAASDQPR